MIPGNANPLLLASAAAADTGVNITKSLRFNSGDSAYLDGHTPSSASNRRTWTWSAWVKKADTGVERVLFNAHNSSDSYTRIRYVNTDEFQVYMRIGSGTNYYIRTNAKYRDHSGWYHLVAAVDTTQATAADRVKLYVNGVEQTLSQAIYPPQNGQTAINSTLEHSIGSDYGSNNFDGYMTDIHLIDGSQLEPTSFGAFDANGVWQAAAYSGTYGTNGFHLLDFANESTIGHDSSGNENDFTANNFTNVEANNTDGIDNLANLSNLKEDGSNITINLANLRSVMNSSEFQDADTDQTSHAVRIGGADKRFGIKWSGLTGLTSISLRWQRASSYDADVKVTGTGITEATTTLTSSRVKTTFSTTSTTGQMLMEDVTTGNTNGFQLRSIEFDGYGSVTYPTNVENFVFPGSDQDVLFDVPANGSSDDDTGAGGEVSGNYATFNPLATPWTLEDGNLEGTSPSSPTRSYCPASIYVNSGKWYAEIELTNNGGTHQPQIGVVKAGDIQEYIGYTGTGGVGYEPNVDRKYASGTATTSFYGQTYTSANYIFGLALDMDAGTLDLYIDGVSLGELASGLSGYYTFAAGDIRGAGLPNVIGNFGQRPFAYSAPSGYKPLCTTLLPTPTIADGSDYFETLLYTGTGANQSISGLSFESAPDFVWIKRRNGAGQHVLTDSVRGTSKQLFSSLTNAEQTSTTGITSFDSDGFSLGTNVSPTGSTNGSSSTYAAWCWDAGANSSKTFTVKVVSDSGNKYRFDDFGTSAVTLDLEEGSTYVFDQSDSSNSGHPLRFSTTSDGTHGSGSEYTTGVTTTGTPGSAGAKTTIVVASSAPTLYYYCSAHSGMGGQANTNSTAGASNFDGSIQAAVRANQTAGISIVSYTGNGTAGATVGHGLNAEPFVIISKNRDDGNAVGGQWYTYHKSLGNSTQIQLQSDNQAGSGSSFLNSTTPTSSVFARGSFTAVNKNGDDYIAYCFAPIAGYSAFGSYEGDGTNSNGPFVYLGFRPAWVMIKNADSNVTRWMMYDSVRETTNEITNRLRADKSGAEYSDAYNRIDFLSNGFKIRGTAGSDTNTNNNTLLYFAFAENPFQANGGLAR